MSDARENKISRKRKIKPSTSDGRMEKSPKKKPSSVQLEVDEDFPRGGSNKLTPLEVRQIKNEAEKDILFGASPNIETKIRSKKKSKKHGDLNQSTGDSFVYAVKDRRTVESLSFKNLIKGDLLLGVVQDVFEFELSVSLPNNLSGCVHITNINKAFTSQLEEATKNEDTEHETLVGLQKFFPVGTILKCAVVSTDSSKHGHNKIKLSVDPVDVNSGLTSSNISPNMVICGYVTSIEDHGYAICFGIDGLRGFLSKKNVSDELCVGQLVDCLVISTSADKRLVQLQCDKSKNKAMVTRQTEGVVFSSLLPGMLVKATVKEVSSRGVAVTFLGGFEGSVDLLHLKENGGHGSDLEKIYPLKTKVLSCITFVCPATKTVGLSMLQKVVENEPFSFAGHTIGDVVEDATVTRLDQGRGLLLQLSESVSGYAHISRLSDEHVTKIDKKFRPGTKHSCRILSMNSLTGLALVSLEQSIIEKPFIRYHDIKPGTVVTGNLQSFLKSGILVAFSDHIRGFCHSLHYADVPLKHPEKKLHEGKKLKCRVLLVDPERKRLHVTHKKTLVNSELPPITNYSDIALGMKTHGFIKSIRDYGCIINFYNNVRGIVPKTELGLKASESQKDAFYVGQVVTCVVISCSPSEQKLSLSFNLSAKPSSNSRSLTPGTLVDVDIVGKTDSGLDVQITPSNTPAFLPRVHLSDHLSHCGPLLEIFSPSFGNNTEVKSLSNVLYYGRNKEKSLIVSRKPSLIKMTTEGSRVKRFEDLQVGMILPGSIRQIMPYGIFIEFSPNVYGLAPNSFLSDKYVADASQHFHIGQSVLGKVTEIDNDRRRFLVSLKRSECHPEQSTKQTKNDDILGVNILEDYIQEREGILEKLSNSSEDQWSFTKIAPGSLVTAKVTEVKNHGTTFLLEGGVQGFAPLQLTQGMSVAVGDVCEAFVLDHDIENKRVYLTVDTNTVRQRKETATLNKKKLKPDQLVPVIVQLIHSEYMVVVLPSHGFRVGYVPVKAYLNDIRDPISHFTIGQMCNATVQRYVGSKLGKHSWLIVSVVSSQEKNVIKPGDIATGVVKSIKDLQMNIQLAGGKYHGRVHVTEISDYPAVGTNPLTVYKCGEKIQVKVVGFRDSKNHNFLPITHRNFTKGVAELSTRSSRLREDDNNNEGKKFVEKELTDYKKGEKILCFVKSVRNSDIWMSVSTSVDGRVTLLDIATDLKVLEDLSSHFKIGVGYHCTVLDVDKDHKYLVLSLSGCDVKKGQIVPGKISKILPNKGLAVHLSRQKSGLVFLTDLSDKFKEDPLKEYRVNQLVSCYVLAVNKDGHIELSTRPSKTHGMTSEGEPVESSDMDKEIQSLDDIEEGDIVRGYVKSVSDVGLFVSLSRSVVARVQIKHVSQYFVKNWKPLFHVGKLVKGKILSIDPCSNHIELSLRGKDTGDKDPAPKPERKENSKFSNGKRAHASSDSEDENDSDILLKKLRKGEDGSDDESMEEESKHDSEDESSESDNEENVDEERPRLKVSGGFDWNSSKDDELPTAENPAEDSDDDDDASEAEESTQVARKKSKRAKRAAKKAEEDFLYKTEQALLNQDKGPQTAEDFDRILLGTPNDSLLWLQYMAFYLHLTEIDKARAVAERALKSISFREESEKFNIWIAFLNLENSYGTQESLMKVFQRALEQNEPKKVFKQLINIYVKSSKFELADQLHQTMLKRFKSSKKVWTDYAGYLMERGEVQSARNLLQRSLKSLEKRKHIETITRFATLEFKYGEPERGRTLLDNILTSYPKRTDIWSMYIDVLIRNEDIASARRLFERAVTFKLSSKKMKFVFKRYLEFEKKYGDESTIASVKKMAEEFVRDKTG